MGKGGITEFKIIKSDEFSNFETELLKKLEKGWRVTADQPNFGSYWKFTVLLERKLKDKKVQI